MSNQLSVKSKVAIDPITIIDKKLKNKINNTKTINNVWALKESIKKTGIASTAKLKKKDLQQLRHRLLIDTIKRTD
jgi:hypothetical protein